MARKKRGAGLRQGYYTDTYWQSAAYSTQLYRALFNQCVQLAMTRFKWVNLPETCNERYLEYTLFWKGAATIAHPKSQPGVFYSTQMAQVGRPNVYDNPAKWRSIGNNAWQFGVTPLNGVIVYDNITRMPLQPILHMYVLELVDIYRTKQLNRMHIKTPYLIAVPNEMELAATNTIKQILGGEPAIIGNPLLREMDIQAINTGVQFLGMELTAEEMNVWNKIYTALGISNLTFKAERQIEDEVRAFEEPTDLLALSPLSARREAAATLNERFGLDIHVVWRQDNESENYNALTNINDLREIIGGTTGGIMEGESNAVE